MGEVRQAFGVYKATDAQIIAQALDAQDNLAGAAITARQAGTGQCLFTPRLIASLPKMKYSRSVMDERLHLHVRGNPEDGLPTARETAISNSL